MTKKNDIFLGTRVNGKLFENIDDYCRDYKISKSKLIRNALIYFLRFARNDEDSFHPMMIFSKEELKYMFKCMNEEQLIEFADLSYQMGQMTRKYYFENISKESNIEIKPRVLLKSMMFSVFSYLGQNWFSKIHYSFEGKTLLIAGSHKLNINFSRFFKYLMLNYLKPYYFNITDDNLMENKIILKFSK